MEILSVIILAGIGLLYAVIVYFKLLRPSMHLAQRPCSSCGKAFGFLLAFKAGRAYQRSNRREYAETQRRYGGGVFVSPDPRWTIECPHCRKLVAFNWTKFEITDVA